MSRKNKSQHARRRENDRRYFKSHPEEVPSVCKDCGRSDVKLQFHHERYDVPRVGRFICDECHMKVHGTKPNLEKRAAKAAKNKYAQFSKQIPASPNPGGQQLPDNPQV